MKNVDTGNIKNFCELAGKLQESDKKEVMDVIQTLAAMTKEQHRIYDALMEKTILTIPEDDMNRGHSEFISYAAEAVCNGATLEELLEKWAEFTQEGKFLPAEQKAPEGETNAEVDLFNKIYHSNKTMEMLCHCENWFRAADEEISDVIKAFAELPEPYNANYKKTFKEAWQLLAAIYNLGRIHGIRAERERQQKRGKENGTGNQTQTGTGL